MKRSMFIIPMVAIVLLLAGCSTTSVTLAPIGPNPMEIQSSTQDGTLEVFSVLSGHTEGSNPAWYRYSDYSICDEHGQRLQYVDNSRGYYSERPAVISLPPGRYVIEARARRTLSMKVPVVIRAGEKTSVHLNGDWQAPVDASKTELVNAPAGYPVGWSANPGR